MEIYHNGGWGTVCGNSWDIRDARVVCKQLGFPDAEIAYDRANFGEGTGQILMDKVHCTGFEPLLSSCFRDELGNHHCNHSQDVGVRCHGTGGKNKNDKRQA